MNQAYEQHFIHHFVQRDRRERAQFELSSVKKRSAFLNRLCHTYQDVLDMRYVHELAPELHTPTAVIASLKEYAKTTLVYVISMKDSIDGREMQFQEAIAEIFFYSFPSIILIGSGGKGYFQAEQEVSVTPRYLLEKRM